MSSVTNNENNEKMETALKRANEDLRRANEEISRLVQMKLDFASMVSHELRTPLSAIKEGIDIVLDGIDGPVTAEQRQTLVIAKNNVDRLSRLITNVLDYSKMEFVPTAAKPR